MIRVCLPRPLFVSWAVIDWVPLHLRSNCFGLRSFFSSVEGQRDTQQICAIASASWPPSDCSLSAFSAGPFCSSSKQASKPTQQQQHPHAAHAAQTVGSAAHREPLAAYNRASSTDTLLTLWCRLTPTHTHKPSRPQYPSASNDVAHHLPCTGQYSR